MNFGESTFSSSTNSEEQYNWLFDEFGESFFITTVQPWLLTSMLVEQYIASQVEVKPQTQTSDIQLYSTSWSQDENENSNSSVQTTVVDSSVQPPTTPIQVLRENTPIVMNFNESNRVENTKGRKPVASSKKRKRNFSPEELEQLQHNMVSPRAKYIRNATKPYDSMTTCFKFK